MRKINKLKVLFIIVLIGAIAFASVTVYNMLQEDDKPVVQKKKDKHPDPYDVNINQQLANITDVYPPESLSDLTKYYGSGNLSASASFGLVGQCTWYAYGRFYETTGIRLNSARNAKYWLKENKQDERVTVTYDLNAITDHCIAVRESGDYGHVMFVEHVVFKDHQPYLVYLSECNADDNGVLDEGECVVKKRTFEQFIKNREIAGYIIAK